MSTDTTPPPKCQVAVVTGGGRGIGAAIARSLARAGAHVVVCGRHRSLLDQCVAAITASEGGATAVECDVTDLSSVESLARFVEDQYEGCDVLVNNAGVGGFGGPLHTLDPHDWEQILNTNLRGVYYCIRAFAPMMMRARSGHIINISSIAGKNALANGAAYCASKWGLNGLSYSVAEELRTHNIRVSVICPGSTNTELSPHTGKDPSRMLRAEDVAHVVTMLVTQAPNSFVSEIVLRPTTKP